MAFILNSTTIKKPTLGMKREPIEVSTDHITIDGTTKKDITARKYRYILPYRGLSKTDADTILSIYNLKEAVTFESTETNFTVSEREVHVDITPLGYNYLGTAYLSDFDLILTEVEET